jgi:membrane protease YdiL (CAAX protease family)
VTEETGWRGFALLMLQNRVTPLAATVIVGLMRGVWHFPARPDILSGAYGLWGGALLLTILLVRFLVLSIVMTFFYNRVGGSTLIAISMHGLHNDSVFLQGRINAEGLSLRGLQANLARADRGRGLRPDVHLGPHAWPGEGPDR